MKAEKNRAKVEEVAMKATHAARAELAQSMREEKKRKEREHVMEVRVSESNLTVTISFILCNS